MPYRNAHSHLTKEAEQRADVYLTEQFKELIEEAESQIEQIQPEDLYVLDKEIVLIDVREPEEFGSGYINAHNSLTIPRGKLEFMAIKKIAEVYGADIPIVTYCLKGPRGSLAGLQLIKMGFTNVKNLDGGILNWLEKGNTIHSYLGELSLAK